MNEMAALDVAWTDLQAIEPPPIHSLGEWQPISTIDEIEPLANIPTSPPIAVENSAKAILDMIGIFDSEYTPRLTLSPQVVSHIQATGNLLEWSSASLVREMTNDEESTDMVAIFKRGRAAQAAQKSGVAPVETTMERDLRKWSRRLKDGDLSVLSDPQLSPTRLLDVLMSPSDDLKQRMKFTSRSKGPRPVKHFTDVAFMRAVMSPFCKVYPASVGLVPTALWKGIECVRFGELVEVLFQRRNNDNSRFTYKMCNALLLTDDNPDLFCVVGLKWVNDSVMALNKRIFAQLLGIAPTSVDGALLNSQGNFSTHGCVEVSRQVHLIALGVTPEQIMEQRVAGEDYRFLVHAKGALKRSTPPAELEQSGIKWKKEALSLRDACQHFGLAYN